MNSPAGEPQGPKRTPLPNPLPVPRGEGEATPRSLSALIQRQWGTGEGEEWASVVPVILHSSFILRASAARLRSETTLPINWIAARVQIGTAKWVKSVLQYLAQRQDQRQAARTLEPCAQLEFQSSV
jgi:hypothetical protein